VSSDRERLLAELLDAGREHSTAVVLFHSAMAAASGLTPTESKALELIQRGGGITPAELARLSGLAPASVTALLDRLEHKGVARRAPHPTDGRRFLVEIDPAHAERSRALFDEFVASVRELAAGYDDDQLATITGFLRGAAERQLRSTHRLTADDG
jgi:DNA-binding MarR family transcriptional regulator